MMEFGEEKSFNWGLVAFGLFVVAPIGLLISGWVLTIVWNWFLVPLCLPPISIPHAVGLSLVFSYFLHQDNGAAVKDIGALLTRMIIREIFKIIWILTIGGVCASLMN